MRWRSTTAAAVWAAAAMAACRDIPAPAGGVASISALLLPAPGVVAGDTLRDSAGVAAPLRVLAYDVGGNPLDPQPAASFVVLDTGAHLEGGPFLVGDTPGTTVDVVGGIGSLQTKPVAVLVTLSPDTLVPAADTILGKPYVLGQTTDFGVNLEVIAQHLNGTPSGVAAVIVYFAVDSTTSARAGAGPLVELASGNQLSGRDTTDASGHASRTLRLRIAALDAAPPALNTDTAWVTATTAYRGLSIGAVRFTVVYTQQ